MMIVFHQENVKSFNIEDVGTFDTVSKMKSEISNLRSDLVNQEKLTGEDQLCLSYNHSYLSKSKYQFYNLKGDLTHDIKLMDALSAESQRALGLTQVKIQWMVFWMQKNGTVKEMVF